MAKYRKHQYKDDDMTDDDNDDDLYYSPEEEESNDSDMESMNKHKKKIHHPYNDTNNTPNTNSYSNYFKITSDDEEEEINDDMEVMEDMDRLLETPMSAAARAVYTCRGIKLIVENNRSRKWFPTCWVNIADWKPIYIVNAFNTILKRFGTTTDSYTPYLCWDKQNNQYAADWNDLDSLYIPWGRPGIHVFLSKIHIAATPQKRKAETTINGNNKIIPKKRRTNKMSNKQKNSHRQEVLQYVMEHIDVDCKRVIEESNDDSLWYRVAHLYDRADWSMDKIEKMIMNGNLASNVKRKIDKAQEKVKFAPEPHRAEVTSITRDIMNATSDTTDTTISTSINNKNSNNGIGANSRYFKQMIKEDMKQINNNKSTPNINTEYTAIEIEKEWNQRQIQELLDYSQQCQKEMRETMESTKKELDEIQKVMKKFDENHNK